MPIVRHVQIVRQRMFLTELDFIEQFNKRFLIVCVFPLTFLPSSGMNKVARETRWLKLHNL